MNLTLGILYQDYVAHIKELQPEIILMENVYGLAQVKATNMMEKIYKSFENIGYEITHRQLLATDYGTPQKRKRLFFVAAKNLNYFCFPTPTHYESKNIWGLPLYNRAGASFRDLPPALIR